MRRWFLVLIAVAAMVLALPGCESLDPGAGASQESETTRLWQKADANAALITGLTGRVGALEAQAATEVSTASFNALQNEVGSLRTSITALEARIAELEAADDGGGGSSGDGTGDIVSETRWRLRPSFDITGDAIGTGVDPDNPDVEIYVRSVEPRTIKPADVYEISLEMVNNEAVTVEYNNVVFSLLFEPNDDVIVSEDCDVYQVAGPYSIFWNTDVRTSSSTGICRYIKCETDSFDVELDKDEVLRIDLEFELIYE